MKRLILIFTLSILLVSCWEGIEDNVNSEASSIWGWYDTPVSEDSER